MRKWLLAGLRAALVLAAFAIAHGARIVANLSRVQWEDKLFFGHVAKDIHSIVDVFTHGSFWTGLYRPLSTNLFYYAVGTSMPALHTILLLVHLANLFLLYRVARLFVSGWLATLACVLFASRLAHADVVLYASQMQTVLPMTFTLLALWFYARERLIFACVALALGFLAKESTITVVLVLFAYRILFAEDRRKWAYWIAPAAVTSVYALLLAFVIPRAIGRQHYWTYVFAYPAVTSNIAAYLWSYSNLLLHPIRPRDPAIFITDYPTIIRLSTSWLMRIAIGLIAVAALVPIFIRTNRNVRTVAFAFLWFLFSVAPVACFNNRLLLYYSYAGTAALSLGFAALVQLAITFSGRFRKTAR